MHIFAATTSDWNNSLCRLPAAFLFRVLSKEYMTSSIPESFNLDELSKMLETAPQEHELHTSNDDKEFSEEDFIRVAEEAIDYASKRIPSPTVHKLMMMVIANKMLCWHNNMAEMQLEEGNTESAAAWYRDAGKFQSLANILTNISVGPDDWTCVEN